VHISGDNFEFTLGSGFSATDTVKYYIVAQDVSGNLASFPSSGAGSFTTSPPTAGTPPTTPSSYIIGVALTGTYTVGSGGNYSTLTEAAGSYNGNCLAGPVVFSLTDATYSTSETFPITFNSNPYASIINTLSIIPATGVTSTITGSASTPLIILNGADFVTVDGSNNGTSTRNLTILNSATANPSVFQLKSLGTDAGATNNTIKNCIIRTGVNSTIGYGIAIGGSTIGTAGSDNDSILIENNIIEEPLIGIYGIGNSINSATGLDYLRILNNSISYTNSLASGIAIKVGNSTGSLISQNTISIETSSTTLCGISLESGFVNSTVSRNLISKVKTTNTSSSSLARGISIGTGQASSNLNIINNVIYNVISPYPTSTVGWNPCGIMVGAIGVSTTVSTVSGGINIDNNSINLYGSADRSIAALSYSVFFGSSASNINLRNNNLANSINNINATGTASKAYAIYSQSASTAFSNINYNDYFVSGTQGVLGFLSADVTTLTALQTAFGQNVNSLNVNPDFNSNTNIRPNLGSPVLNAGTPILGLTIDYLGVTRNVTTPSMGAYENGADGVGPVISYTAVPNQCSVSGVNLTASVYDISGVPTSGADVPTLYWKTGLNGTYASVQGTYTSGTNFDFTFGAGVATNDTIFYYIVAQDSINNVSVSPSAGAAVFTTSPPAVATAPSSPSSFRIGTVLSGTIPVGTGGTYTTLSSAASAYNIGCISGPIIFSLTDATYSSSETFPITFNNNSGASLTNTLSILPATGVNTTITGSSATGLIVLNGSEYITIDGSNNGTTSKNLTILNTNVSATTAGIILNSLGVNAGASNNTIKNTIFTSSINSVSNFGISIGGASPGTTGADNDSITISGNSFSNFGFGIYVGGTSSGVSDFINVSNNSHIYNGLTLSGPMFFRSTFINNSKVSGNSVDIITTAGTSPVGISLGANVTNTLVEKNYLNRILTTSTSGYGGRGITVGTGLASSNITISNNVIFGVNGSNYSAFGNSSSMGIALGIDGSSTTLTTVTGGVNIYFNSINLYGNFSYTTNTLTTSIYVGSAASALDIRNNVFTNSLFNTNSSGVSSKAYSIYSAAANTAFTNIDFNNYFVSGGQGVLAYLSTDVTTISGLRTAFGFNVNSINSDPLYNSDALLQPSIGSPLISVGTPIAGFSTDFTGTSRSLTSPSIGAYEIGRDGAAPTISFTSLSNTQLLTNITLVSNIADLGSGAIGLDSAGANRPTVYFKKSSEADVFGLANNNTSNGWKYTQTTSTSSPFSLEIDYSLLNTPVAAGDTILYFVTAQDLNGNLGAESSAGFAGTSVTNITSAPSSLNRYFIVGPPLSGTYSVGPGGNYTRITDAVNDLNLRGLSSPVVFELTDTVYSSNESFPIVLSNTPNGISSTNTVKIQPAGVSTDCRITGSNATAIFSVDNGDYYILDGRSGGAGSTPLMTILNTSTSAGAIRFVNDATNNIVRYCKLRGIGSVSTAGVVNFGTTTGTTGNDDNTITNNDIYDGATSPVSAIYSIGQDSAKSNNGNIISDNNIYNFGLSGTSYGVHLAAFNTYWNISGNSFYSQNAKTLTGTYYAIYISAPTGNGHNVTSNFIGGTAPQCGSTPLTLNSASTVFQFIYLNVDSGAACNVNNNTIKNINITTTSTSTAQALIYVNAGAVNVGTGSGNHIGDQTNSGSVVINTNQTSTTFAAIAVGSGTKMGNVEISNNDIGGITVNQVGGVGGMSLRGIDIGAATRGLFTIANNIIGGNAPGNMLQNTGNNALAFINRTTSNGRLHIVSGNIIRNFTTTSTTSSITGLSSGATINSSITNNTIYGLTSAQTTVGTGTSSSLMGLVFGLQSTVLENTCSGNVIYGLNNTGAAKITVTGLVVNTAATGTHNVFKNFVHSLNSSNDSSSLVGIHIAGGNANIYNNMVRLGIDSNGTDINTNRMIAGIVEAGGTSGVYFNTVYIGGAAVSTGLANTYGFYSTLTSGTRVIRNNIFTNKRMNSGSTGNHFAIYLATTGLNPTGLTLNNNNYFSSNSTIGYYNGSNRATFSNWRTAVGLDAASMNEDPSFINATGSVSNINLHITPATTSLMESGGFTISGISTDYDGDARPGPAGSINGGGTAVDIGADEFDGGVFPINMSATALVGPIGTCATTGKTVVVRIKNNSPTTTIDFSVNNVTVNADVTGPNATTFTPVVLTTDTLAVGATMDVTISTNYDMSLMGTYTFNASTLVTGDANNSDDAMSAAVIEIDTLVTGTITSSVSQYCYTTGTPSFTTTATGGDIQWLQSTAGPNGPWTNVGTNSTSYVVSSNLTQSTWVTATNTCNSSTIWLDDTSAVHLPVLVSVTGDTVCGTGTVSLSATVGLLQSAKWYTTSSGGAAIYTGTNYSPTISASTDYYVAAVAPGFGNMSAGKANRESASSGTNLSTYGQLFTITTPITLNSVKVESTTGTAITISLYDASGSNQLFTTGSQTVPTNTISTVNLGWTIPAGTYRLAANAMTGNFYRDNTNTTYPIAIGNIGSITGFFSTITGTNTTSSSYYFMYDWSISAEGICESSRSMVSATVITPPNLTISSATSSICEGSSSSSPITITSTVGDYNTYDWTPSSSVSGNSVSGYNFNPTTTTTYTLTGLQTSGSACQNTTTHTVTVNPRPDAMTISPSSATVCPSASQLLAVTSGGYINTFDTVGTGAVENTLSSYPSPLSNFYGGTKHQMLITAAELNALGVPANSPLTSISFFVNSVGPTFSGSLSDFSIQMGNTASTGLTSSSFISAPTMVRAAATLNVSSTGWITIPLNGTFSWNGTSNLVIQTSYSNANSGTSDDGVTMLSSTTSFVSCNWYRDDAVTASAILTATTPTSSASTRPNMILKAVVTPTFVWSAQTDLYRDNAGLNAYSGGDSIAVYTMPQSARTYTVTATTSLGCARTASVSVSVGTVPSAPGTISTANTTTTGVDLSWATVSGATSYKLDVATDALFASMVSGYNNLTVAGLSQAVTGLTAGTTYYARVRGVNTCGASANSSTLTTITLSSAPVLSAASSVSGTGMTINWTATTGAASYLLDVSTSNTFNTFVSGYNGLAVPTGTSQAVTGLSAGTRYYYRVLAVNAGGNSAYSSTGDTVTLSGSATLSLTAFFEGLYLGGSTMTSAPYNADNTLPASIADTITVELHVANGTFDLAYSVTDTISVNGTASISLPGAAVGNYYYIVLKHRNSLETWSADSVLISSSLSYDFSSAATQAYGSNMVDLGSGVFGIYAGDINQDGFIDGNDFTDVDNDNSNFASGYLYTDTNGDGFVDGNDFTLIDNNGSMFIGIARP
jgi:hypothetical protein